MKPSLRQRINIASVALGVGLLLLGITPRVPPLERTDHVLTGILLDRIGSDATSLLGTGAHDNPRRARGAPARVPPTELPPPRFLSITDDPEGLFETRPPGPGDIAFALERLHTLGHRKLSSSALLSWDTPDPIAAGALDHELGRFRPAVIGAPLVRGLSDELIPPAFERLSVPLGRITGETGTLPIVNRVAVPGIRLGGDSCWGAFTRLESEAPPLYDDSAFSVPVPLLARWADRVVVALPLAHLMARFDISADQLVITPGSEIRLGESGPIIPIDLYGQTPVRPGTAGNAVVVPAEELVRPADERVPAPLRPDTVPLLLRDDRTDAPAAVQEYSAHLGDIIVALERAPRAGAPDTITRPHTSVEILLVTALALLAGWIAPLPWKLRHAGLAGLCLGSLLVSLLLLSTSRSTPPPLAILGTPLAGWMIALFLPRETPPRSDQAPPAGQPSDASPRTTPAATKKARAGKRRPRRRRR